MPKPSQPKPQPRSPIADGDWIILECGGCHKPIRVRQDDLGEAEIQCPICSATIAQPDAEALQAEERKNWHVLQCGDCAQIFKAPKDTAPGEMVACPNCEAAVLIPESTEPSIDSAESSESSVPSTDSAEDTQFESPTPQPTAETQSPKRFKREFGNLTDAAKERRATPEAKKAGKIIKAERVDPAALGWDNDSSSASPAFPLKIGIAITCLIFFSVIAFGILKQKAAIPDSGLDSDPLKEPSPIFLTSDMESGALRVVRDYFRATTIDERLTYVRQPNRVAQLMRDFYLRTDLSHGELGEVENRKLIQQDGKVFLLLHLWTAADFEPKFFSVECLPNGDYKVDWEVSAAYQPISFDEFKSKKPKDLFDFRLVFTPSDFYSEVFPEDKWLCFRLSHPTLDVGIYGYFPRDSEQSLEWEARHKNGVSLSGILTLKFPEEGKYSNQVLITRLAHDSWYF